MKCASGTKNYINILVFLVCHRVLTESWFGYIAQQRVHLLTTKFDPANDVIGTHERIFKDHMYQWQILRKTLMVRGKWPRVHANGHDGAERPFRAICLSLHHLYIYTYN